MNFDFDMSIPDKTYNHREWTPTNTDWQTHCKMLAEDETRNWVDIKSDIMVHILKNAPVSVNTDDIFCYIIRHDNIMSDLTNKRKKDALSKLKVSPHNCEFSIYPDFSHSSPDWDFIVKHGLVGIRKILSEKEKLAKNKNFYQNAIKIIDAIFDVMKRFILVYEKDSHKLAARFAADNLKALIKHEPQTLAQALHLFLIIYWVVDRIEAVGVRSFGRMDKTLLHLYESDLESGAYTKQDEEKIIAFFFGHLNAMNNPYNIPLCLGGCDGENGGISVLTREMLRIHTEMKLYSPKLQLRVSESTPDDLLRQVLTTIRSGNNSYVIENDKTVIAALMKIGIDYNDAKNYLPIGCYEPSVPGCELPCTSNGSLIIPHAVQRAIGVDAVEEKYRGDAPIGEYENFESFYQRVKLYFKETADLALSLMNTIIDPVCSYALTAPLYSVLFPPCIESGIDLYDGGAKYNNNSMCLIGFSTAIDSILAIKQLVFDEKKYTLTDVRKMLNSNWEGFEKERLYILNRCPKYGNGDEFADKLTADFTSYCINLVNGRPNRRGGVFRVGLWSIQSNQSLGRFTGATADGRKKGEPINQNLSPSIGMDKNGVTALIKSVTSVDATLAPNGAVLDLMLHPSSVHGEKGMDAFMALIKLFLEKGGQAIQVNVLDSETLREAQLNPEKFSTLQVRVCGWNAYFTNLTKQEQDIFIKTAESLC